MLHTRIQAINQPAQKTRYASALPLDDGGLKNKILVIHNKPEQLQKISFWSSPSVLELTPQESEHLLQRDLAKARIPYS